MNGTRADCDLVYTLREEGYTQAQVASLAGVSITTVRTWLGNPAKYDPYIDEIAVRRASEGDADVFRNLTYWERNCLINKLVMLRQSMLDGEWLEHAENLRKSLGLTESALRMMMGRLREAV